MLKILEKFLYVSKQDPDLEPKPSEKSDPVPNKYVPDPQHWFLAFSSLGMCYFPLALKLFNTVFC
jgi:hypothetical protein